MEWAASQLKVIQLSGVQTKCKKYQISIKSFFSKRFPHFLLKYHLFIFSTPTCFKFLTSSAIQLNPKHSLRPYIFSNWSDHPTFEKVPPVILISWNLTREIPNLNSVSSQFFQNRNYKLKLNKTSITKHNQLTSRANPHTFILSPLTPPPSRRQISASIPKPSKQFSRS